MVTGLNTKNVALALAEAFGIKRDLQVLGRRPGRDGLVRFPYAILVLVGQSHMTVGWEDHAGALVRAQPRYCLSDVIRDINSVLVSMN